MPRLGTDWRGIPRGLLGAVLASTLVFIVFCLADASHARVGIIKAAGPPIAKHLGTLPSDEIDALARIAREVNGTKKVGAILAKRRLPNEVLEDTYLRIAVAQGRIGRSEAELMHRRLHGTEGLRTTLRKVIGNSAPKSNGHLHELRLASEASAHGMEVVAIGSRFKDPAKSGLTDIDVLLERTGARIAIESKNYSRNSPLPLDAFRADMRSLSVYSDQQAAQGHSVIKVFALTNRPANYREVLVLQREAKRQDVHLIYGHPAAQIQIIRHLN